MSASAANRISAALSKTDQEKAIKGVQAVQKLLPFLVSLTEEERKELFRVGDKSRAFIAKANEAATAHAEGLPRQFDEDEFKKDAALLATLYPVVMAVRQLANSLEDTLALVESEAYAGALVVYRSLKDNDTAGLFESAVDDLSRRFVRKSAKKAPGADPAAPPPAPTPNG